MTRTYLLSFLIAFGVTYFLTPFVIRFAILCGAVDHPDERKIHTSPIPRWGGIGIFAGTLAGVLFAFFYSHTFRAGIQVETFREIWGIAGACVLMVAVGMVDDRKPVDAKIKLFFQLAAAAWLIWHGVRISFFTVPFSGKLFFLPGYVSITLSFFWIVGITNALNLLDGLDGLLAGISTISGLALFGIAVQKGYIFPAFVLIAMSGSTLAFLRYNFNPALVFLGDAGSLFLGMLWASISISGALKTSTTALFIPFLILGLPIADTFFAIVRRFGKGQSIFKPDKEHLHHRLLKRGWSQRKAVLVLYLMGGILGSLALFLDYLLK